MTLKSYHSARNWHSSRWRASGAFVWPVAWSLLKWMLSRRTSLWATKVEHFYTTLASPLSRPTLWNSMTKSPIRSGLHRSWRISIRKVLESSLWALICMRSGVCCTRWAWISHSVIFRGTHFISITIDHHREAARYGSSVVCSWSPFKVSFDGRTSWHYQNIVAVNVRLLEPRSCSAPESVQVCYSSATHGGETCNCFSTCEYMKDLRETSHI